MPWFRMEDSFHSHPKVVAAGNEAIGLYVRCGTYAAQHLTDGFIPGDIAVLYGSSDTGSRRNPGTGKPETLAETLVRTKLWRRTRGGWRMPDYLDYNPSAERVDNQRAAKATRQKRWLESQRRRGGDASQDASIDLPPSPPRPEGSGAGKPAPSASARRNGAAPRSLADRTVADAIADAMRRE